MGRLGFLLEAHGTPREASRPPNAPQTHPKRSKTKYLNMHHPNYPDISRTTNDVAIITKERTQSNERNLSLRGRTILLRE